VGVVGPEDDRDLQGVDERVALGEAFGLRDCFSGSSANARERQRERSDNRLQGGRLGGRDAPKAPGGALAPVRVGPAGAPLEGAGPSTTDPALTVHAESRQVGKRISGL
jgi:hypothetical protein